PERGLGRPRTQGRHPALYRRRQHLRALPASPAAARGGSPLPPAGPNTLAQWRHPLGRQRPPLHPHRQPEPRKHPTDRRVAPLSVTSCKQSSGSLYVGALLAAPSGLWPPACALRALGAASSAPTSRRISAPYFEGCVLRVY